AKEMEIDGDSCKEGSKSNTSAIAAKKAASIKAIKPIFFIKKSPLFLNETPRETCANRQSDTVRLLFTTSLRKHYLTGSKGLNKNVHSQQYAPLVGFVYFVVNAYYSLSL